MFENDPTMPTPVHDAMLSIAFGGRLANTDIASFIGDLCHADNTPKRGLRPQALVGQTVRNIPVADISPDGIRGYMSLLTPTTVGRKPSTTDRSPVTTCQFRSSVY